MKKNKLFKSAHVPLKVCLKLAMKNVWKKKFRFLTVILICSISLAFLSFTIELNGDKLRQNIYTMIENGYNYTTIKEHLPLSKDKENDDFYNKYNSKELSPNSYEKIKSELSELDVHKYSINKIRYAQLTLDQNTDFYPGYINTLIQYDSTNEYKLLAGRLPNDNEKEILITDYLVSAFNYYDVFMDHGTNYDYLYKYLTLSTNEKYKIVGVVETNFSNWVKYSGYRNLNIDETDKTNYPFYNDFIFMNSVIIPQEFFEIEKQITGFSTDSYNQSNMSINVNYRGVNKIYQPQELSFKNTDLEIYETIVYYPWNYSENYKFGRLPINDNEIAISNELLYNLYNIELSELNTLRNVSRWEDYIFNHDLNLSITIQSTGETYNKTYKVVGIVDSQKEILLNQNDYEVIKQLSIDSEKILIELPNNSKEAYNLFQKAYKKGYIINVWEYQTDIDSYTVDPFIDIFSKAGLIVFVAFTIGIMWTIITIEIVDSKKEIGILRSIGLSGIKTSLIFIIQALFVSLTSYIISMFLSNYVITLYNSGITDELNVITLFMYTMTYRTPLYLIIFVLFITGISTLLPLYKIMSQKIIDVINERE